MDIAEDGTVCCHLYAPAKKDGLTKLFAPQEYVRKFLPSVASQDNFGKNRFSWIFGAIKPLQNEPKLG